MKKKLTLVVTCVVLVAAMVIGGTLAYFTDKTEDAVNTFTAGNVKIALNEQRRGKTGLEAFEQNKVLNPGTDSDGNAVSKIVSVTNTGDNDAWVWVDMLIPSYLLDSKNPVDQTYNALHFQEYGAFSQRYWKTYGPTSSASAPVRDHIMALNEETGKYEVIVENMVQVSENTVWTDWEKVSTETNTEAGVEYTILRTKMVGTLPSGKISLPCLCQVYMDWRVTSDGTNYTMVTDKDNNTRQFPVSNTWEVVMRTYAIQADGIANVDKAVEFYNNNGNA